MKPDPTRTIEQAIAHISDHTDYMVLVWRVPGKGYLAALFHPHTGMVPGSTAWDYHATTVDAVWAAYHRVFDKQGEPNV